MEYRLSQIADVVNGATPTTENPDFFDGNIPWFTPKDLSDQKTKYIKKGERFLSKEGFESCSTKIIPPYNILMSSRAPIGLLSINTNECCTNQGFKSLILNKELVDVDYMYYYLRHHMPQIEALGSGTTFREVSKEALEKYKVNIPNIDTQIKIAKILSSLDAKIALNRRMNEELEGMAKMLYDYWFVQFDFPNEEGKPYKSSGGAMEYNAVLKREIPAGWKVKSISDICDVVNGATPSTRDALNFDGNVVWITPKDLSVQKEKFIFKGERNITQQGYDSCNTTIVPQGAILMSSRAPIGLMSIAGNVLCTNQGFKTLVPKNMNDRYYMWYYLQMMMPQIKSLGGGTTFKEVSKDSLLPFPIVNIDCPRVKKNWIETVSPIFKKQSLIVQEVAKLTALRDKLLPLLMNGQVRVAD